MDLKPPHLHGPLISPPERQESGTLPAGTFVTGIDVEEGMKGRREYVGGVSRAEWERAIVNYRLYITRSSTMSAAFVHLI